MKRGTIINMSTYLYDNALINKISSWTSDTNLHIFGPDEVERIFTVAADENGDKPIQLPMITISRLNTYTINGLTKRPLSYSGIPSSINKDGRVILNAIPIKLTYQIDVITRHFKESDEYCRNFIFNIINYPKLQVEIPYLNQKLIHESSISLSADINNSSGFSIRQVAGQLYRHSITITIDDAYLWDVREKGNYKISDIQLYVNDIHEEQYDL